MTYVTMKAPGVRADAGPTIIAGFLFTSIAFVLFYEALAVSDQPTVAVVWGAFALATYCAGLLCVAGASQGIDLGIVRWKMGPWMLLWYAVAFGVATVTWREPQVQGVTTEIALSSVLRALWLMAAGMSAWTVGYIIGPGRAVMGIARRGLRNVDNRFTGEVRSLAAPWILYAIGITARLINAAGTGLFGYVGNVSSAVSTASGYQGILGALTLCAPIAIAAASLQAFRDKRKGARVTLVLLFVAEIGFGVASGYKEGFVIAVLAVVVPFGAARRRLPRAALVTVFVAFLVVVIPFNQAYRSAVRQGSVALTPSQGAATAPAILRKTLSGASEIGVLGASFDYLMQRIREIDNVAIVIQRTPGQLAFANPMQLVEVPVAGMIPRAVWPSKPVLATGYQFSQEFYELPANVYTSSADTIVGGLYWHGGWVTVLFGMALFGIGVRLLDGTLDVRENAHSMFLVLLLFPTLVGGETDWNAILGSLPAILFVWLVSVATIFRRRRQS